MRVYDKINPPLIDGDPIKSKFINAFNICLAKSIANGYSQMGSGEWEDRISLTPLGVENMSKHLSDGKAVRFDELFDKYKQDLG